jgi:hypothetical protein
MLNIQKEIKRVKKLEEADFSLPETKREIFNIVETLCAIIIEQQHEIQELKDEINRLKGEQGKPEIAAKNEPKNKESKNEQLESTPKKPWKKSAKSTKVKIDRTEIITVDKRKLPPDAVFKGYEEKIVQNIIIKTDNVLYKLEKYYSPLEQKTYIAEVDESLRGTEFGAETKALISSLYYENRVTENKIASFLNSNGLFISEGTISNILIKEQSAILTEVKNEILEAGLSCSSYNQIDDTGMKISGKNGFATIICNEKFSVFFINLSKSRETVKSFLTSFLASLFVVLVGDDAGQFKKITERYSLCWIHEERHYKKLFPILDVHRKELERLRGEIWVFYEKLKMYKLNPSEEDKKKLWDEFDQIFGQETKYDKLNDRLRLTFEKKSELLTVLDYPEIPLHNNLLRKRY